MSADISSRDAHWGYVFENASIDSKAISSALKTAGDAVLEKIADSKAISSAIKKETPNDAVLEEITSVSSGYIEKMLTGHDNDPLRPTTD